MLLCFLCNIRLRYRGAIKHQNDVNSSSDLQALHVLSESAMTTAEPMRSIFLPARSKSGMEIAVAITCTTPTMIALVLSSKSDPDSCGTLPIN